MSSVSIPFPLFVAGTTAVATQVNDNNTAIVDYINTNCITKDGLKVATGNLSTSDGDPATDDEYSRRAYVVAQDTALKASNTGMQLGGDSPAPAYLGNTWATVATATTGTAIPVNATNNILLLQMFGNIELQGIAAAVQGSFGMQLEYCFDTNSAGTTGTWTSIGTVSATTALLAGVAYGGMSMSGFSYAVPATAKIVGVRMRVINRGGDYTSIHTGTPRLNFILTRQVPLA